MCVRCSAKNSISLFVQVKQMFDPSGVLNPGIKISESIVHRAYRLYETIKILRDLRQVQFGLSRL